MIASLLKAAVGLAIETPIALVADVLTLGGSITERDETHTGTALKRVARNVADATAPRGDGRR